MKKSDKTSKQRAVVTNQEVSRCEIEVYSTKPRRKPPIDTRPVRGRGTKSIRLSSDKKQQSEL